MTFKVGEESTCCSESAAALAKKHDKPVHFVVGEKTYADQGEAFVALVESTEAFVNKFVTPAKCEVSGTTAIAGKSCACSVEAGQRTELVKAAIKDVNISYKVGDEATCCSETAAKLAKTSGQKMSFVVAGEETCCNQDARLRLARARYAAAVKALAKAEQMAAKSKTESDGSGS